MASKIEDYALIGDCETVALVARDGSIDWLCWPRFDSGACFAALLGTPDHGRWLIAPAQSPTKVARAYVENTLVLETTFVTDHGEVTLVDFMPPRVEEDDHDISDLVRLVVGKRGTVAMKMDLVLRFDYGSAVPWVEKLPDGSGISAVAGPDRVILHAPVELRGHNKHTVAEFTAKEGDVIPFVLTHEASHLPLPAAIDAVRSRDETVRTWRTWSSHCNYGGPWSEAVQRSLITLKALTYRPTGGIVAAPTTSLPEKLGGVRNWDYRYCWLRDATLTLIALMQTGYYEEAQEWRRWLLRAVAGTPEQMQIMYGIGGERRLPEWEIPWLPGYENSKPVRIGNAAADQLQLDVYGEVMDALYQGRQGKLKRDKTAWGMQLALVRHLEEAWRRPDEGIWETRGDPQHFTFSKVMCWVAFDRAVKSLETEEPEDALCNKWRRLRDEIHQDVCRNAFDPAQNSFVQAYGSKQLDASLLLMPLVGFLPHDDPRMIGTVAAIQQRLLDGGFVRRYDTVEMDDGLPPVEGVFLACSFWLVDNLVLQGRRDEATELFERLLALRNDVGLLAEEYDTGARRQIGNFPQAFSHVALINSALNLTRTEGPTRQRAEDEPPKESTAG
ncbi:glycoside hydrolase family 15 protein [Dongia deserti]|uniref:glycoside hydrolase family 15 protein n=1 Tax=Dongia deserti TaxID=2268030 RepID=UPI000E6513A3|nr:glycoside hydrolase family 15 protein [Dongia deserti]